MRNYIVERDHNSHFQDFSGTFVADTEGKKFTDNLAEASTFFEAEAHDLAEKIGDCHATKI